MSSSTAAPRAAQLAPTASAASAARARPQRLPARTLPASPVPALRKTRAALVQGGRAQRLAVRASEGATAETPVDPDDRSQQYEVPFAGSDQPEWLPARFLRSEQLAPGIRKVVLEIEESREFVSMQNCYQRVGQQCQVKVAGGEPRALFTSTPPPDPDEPAHWRVYKKLKGDIFAGGIKPTTEPLSIKAELEVHVTEAEALDVYNLTEDTPIEFGPWVGGGLKIKALHGMFRFRTLLLFAAGPRAAAVMRSVINAREKKGMSLEFREAVRYYQWAENDEELQYNEEAEQWKEQFDLRTLSSTGGDAATALAQLFDDDETLEYDPELSGAVVIGDSRASEEALRDFLVAEGEIRAEQIVLGSDEERHIVHLRSSPEWSSIAEMEQELGLDPSDN